MCICLAGHVSILVVTSAVVAAGCIRDSVLDICRARRGNILSTCLTHEAPAVPHQVAFLCVRVYVLCRGHSKGTLLLQQPNTNPFAVAGRARSLITKYEKKRKPRGRPPEIMSTYGVASEREERGACAYYILLHSSTLQYHIRVFRTFYDVHCAKAKF